MPEPVLVQCQRRKEVRAWKEKEKMKKNGIVMRADAGQTILIVCFSAHRTAITVRRGCDLLVARGVRGSDLPRISFIIKKFLTDFFQKVAYSFKHRCEHKKSVKKGVESVKTSPQKRNI